MLRAARPTATVATVASWLSLLNRSPQPVQPKPVQPQPQPVPARTAQACPTAAQPGSTRSAAAGDLCRRNSRRSARPRRFLYQIVQASHSWAGTSHETGLGYWRGRTSRTNTLANSSKSAKDGEIHFNYSTRRAQSQHAEGPLQHPLGRRVLNFDGGDYRFYATADDGVRVYVDDTLMIDGWKIQPATECHGDISLRPGKHKVVSNTKKRKAR